MYTGRYAYAVACGGGKTQAVIALLAAMFDRGVFRSKTVLVVAQEVRALCSIKRQLLVCGVPDLAVGIVHSTSGAEYPSTGDEKRPIMLATHARVQWDGSLQECCRNRHGTLHDLVIWDEALISTKAITLNLDSTRTALGHFATSGKCPTVAKAHERLLIALAHEEARQGAGEVAREIPPLISDQETELILSELRAMSLFEDLTHKMRERAIKGALLVRHTFSVVNARNGEQSEGLMRYVLKVPDGLENVVILDASHAIDELRQADPTIRSGTTEAMVGFKRYESVKVIHWPIASGRSRTKQDGKALDQAVVIAKTLSNTEPVLFVTFKDWHERQLAQAFKTAGLPVELNMPDGRPWLRIITWGRHTSDNSHTHCKHVVLVGLLRLPLLETASQLAAQKRDLTHRLDKAGLLGLDRSVVAANVMQAMNRGCMRLTDAAGMAHPMTVHIIDHDAALRPLLQKAMPGLRWEAATVKEPTRTEDAAKRIAEYVLGLPENRPDVSKKEIFSALCLDLGKDAKADAMRAALVGLAAMNLGSGYRWKKSEGGRSLVRAPIA